MGEVSIKRFDRESESYVQGFFIKCEKATLNYDERLVVIEGIQTIMSCDSQLSCQIRVEAGAVVIVVPSCETCDVFIGDERHTLQSKK